MKASSHTATPACTSSSISASGGRARRAGLPLPLDGNVIRRDLGADLIRRVSRLLRASIAYGLEHRAPALAHAMQYGRDLDPAQTDEFVGMYVNQRTLDYGEDGRRAVQLFLDRGYEEGLIINKRRIQVEFVAD